MFKSWVHLFSKFTPEALIFELLAICILLASYTAFYVMRKRRLGTMEETVPTGVVKAYLNELIVDAQNMRALLFGLLHGRDMSGNPMLHQMMGQSMGGGMQAMGGMIGAGVPSGGMINATGATTIIPVDPLALQNYLKNAGVTIDPTDLPKIQQVIESQLSDQASRLALIQAEKERIEQELASTKVVADKAAHMGDYDAKSAELLALKKKIADMETRLTEYSIIEDDLADLKRLQAENKTLRDQVQTATEQAQAASAAANEMAMAQVQAPAPAAAAPAQAAEAPAGPTPEEEEARLKAEEEARLIAQSEFSMIDQDPASAAAAAEAEASAPAPDAEVPPAADPMNVTGNIDFGAAAASPDAPNSEAAAGVDPLANIDFGAALAAQPETPPEPLVAAPTPAPAAAPAKADAGIYSSDPFERLSAKVSQQSQKPAAPVAPAAPAADPFANLVDQVEDTLEAGGDAAAPAAPGGKSDDELVAEFEKLLGS